MPEDKKKTANQQELPPEPAPAPDAADVKEETTVPEPETPAEATEAAAPQEEAENAPDPLAEAEAKFNAEHDQRLRLAAEYDNFRKRSIKEKESIGRDVRASTVEKFLPVYDNLSRALEQETADAAYKKGVEMTMNGLLEIFKKLDVVPFGDPGDTFDPLLHNAIMHIEDDNYKEGEIVQVFQKGFKLEDKVIRFAMVQSAN